MTKASYLDSDRKDVAIYPASQLPNLLSDGLDIVAITPKSNLQHGASDPQQAEMVAIVAKTTGVKRPKTSLLLTGKPNPSAKYRMLHDNPAKTDRVKLLLREKNSGTNSPKYDYTIYSFVHKDGTIVHMTQHQFRKTYSLDSGAVNRVIKGTTKQKSVKGWSCLL